MNIRQHHARCSKCQGNSVYGAVQVDVGFISVVNVAESVQVAAHLLKGFMTGYERLLRDGNALRIVVAHGDAVRSLVLPAAHISVDHEVDSAAFRHPDHPYRVIRIVIAFIRALACVPEGEYARKLLTAHAEFPQGSVLYKSHRIGGRIGYIFNGLFRHPQIDAQGTDRPRHIPLEGLQRFALKIKEHHAAVVVPQPVEFPNVIDFLPVVPLRTDQIIIGNGAGRLIDFTDRRHGFPVDLRFERTPCDLPEGRLDIDRCK